MGGQELEPAPGVQEEELCPLPASPPLPPAPPSAHEASLLCTICGKTFGSKRARTNHERTSKSCGGKSPPVKSERVLNLTPAGDRVTILNVTGQEEEPPVVTTLALTPSDIGGPDLTCPYCTKTFPSVRNRKRHSCLLQPSLETSHPRLRLLEGKAAADLRKDLHFNTPSQIFRICSKLHVAARGLHPLIFPGSRVVNQVISTE